MLKQVKEDFENFKKKQKYEKPQAPTNSRGAGGGDVDELRSELMIERNENQSLRDQIEHL